MAFSVVDTVDLADKVDMAFSSTKSMLSIYMALLGGVGEMETVQ